MHLLEELRKCASDEDVADDLRIIMRKAAKQIEELALQLIPTTVDAVEREEWRQELNELKRQNAALVEACESAKAFLESDEMDSLECTCYSNPEWPCRRCSAFTRQTNKLDKALAAQPEVKP